MATPFLVGGLGSRILRPADRAIGSTVPSFPVRDGSAPSGPAAREAGQFDRRRAGKPTAMVKGMIRGALAGAAGATALDVVTYADMAWRGRAASSTPEQVVEEIAKRGGVEIPGDDQERRNRLQGLGAMSGAVTGILVGAAAGQVRFLVLRLGPVVGPALLGAAAMLATDLSMAALGVSDPRTWDAKSWLSDAAPHLAFGAVTYGALGKMSRSSR
jgi:hypothetical protein